MLILLKSEVIVSFPSNKFPFSCLTAWLTLFFSAIALQKQCWLVLAQQMKEVHFSSIQLLSHVRLFATPWTAARQASLSITNSRSLLRLMSIELVMPSPSPPAFSLSQHQGLFQWVSYSHQVAKVYWNFSFSISPSNEYSGLISFRIDWFDLLAVQGTLN